MKYLYALVLLTSWCATAQTKFENGYFIDNSGTKTECMIKNSDWSSSPEAFEYKTAIDGDTAEKKAADVKLFSVGGLTYASAEVDIDQSSEIPAQISTQKNPEFIKNRVFLKEIVEGHNNLYYYRLNNLERYFYQVNGGKILPLVYKKYYVDHYKIDVAKNNMFRQQLWTDVKCGNTSMQEVEKLSYTEKDLKKFFESANLCQGDKPDKIVRESKKGSFNLKASVFLGRHSLSFDDEDLEGHDFGSKSYMSFGIEAEYVLPYWNNSWSIIVEPTYNSFKKEEPHPDTVPVSAEWKYIQVAAGFRHYFFLNEHSKIFVNGGVNYAAISKSSVIKYPISIHSGFAYYPASNSITFGLGAGFNYRKASLELRYNTQSNPTAYSSVSFAYNNMALVARYQFL